MKILSKITGHINHPDRLTESTVNYFHYSTQSGISLQHTFTNKVNIYLLTVATKVNDTITIVKSSQDSYVLISLKNTFNLQFTHPNRCKLLLHEHNSIYINATEMLIEFPAKPKNEYTLFMYKFSYQKNFPTMSQATTPINLITIERIQQVIRKKQLSHDACYDLLLRTTEKNLVKTDTKRNKKNVTEKMANKMHRVKEFIHANINRPELTELTLEYISAQTGIDPTTIKENFPVIYSHKVHEYINSTRMIYAAKLLIELPEDKISAIADHLGIDVSTFNRQFSKHHNMTPTEYKAKHLPNDK